MIVTLAEYQYFDVIIRRIWQIDDGHYCALATFLRHDEAANDP